MEILFIILLIFWFAGNGYKTKPISQGYRRTYKRTYYNYNNKNHSVYVIYNKINRKLYVGMTSNYERRKEQHFDYYYRQKQNKLLYKHMDTTGQHYFIMMPILTGLTRNEAFYVESKLIQQWGTVYPYGYNVNPEIDNRQLGQSVASYNSELYNRLKTIGTHEYRNKLIWGE